jgi:hypothetical protein
LSAGILRAEALGLAPRTDEKLLSFICAQSEVHAQMSAEIRWHCNELHPCGSTKVEPRIKGRILK